MDAKVASCHFDYTDMPSAYCMFELHDPSDKTDETTADAEKWLDVAKTLPKEYSSQVKRIWNNWLSARRELEKIYHQLPTSVFQADINDTNVKWYVILIANSKSASKKLSHAYAFCRHGMCCF